MSSLPTYKDEVMNLSALSTRLSAEIVNYIEHPETCTKEIMDYYEEQFDYVRIEAHRLGIKLNESNWCLYQFDRVGE